MQNKNIRQVLNLSLVIEKLLGDEEVAYQILFHFRNQLESDVEGISKGIENSDLEAVKDYVHSLRGSAGISGAEEIWDKLTEIRSASHSNDLDSIRTLNSDLKLLSYKFLSELNSLKKFTEKYGKKENFSY